MENTAPENMPPPPSDIGIGSLAYWYNETARIAKSLEETDPEWAKILLQLGSLVNDIVVGEVHS